MTNEDYENLLMGSIQNMLSELDKNNDGIIEWKEFKAFFFN